MFVVVKSSRISRFVSVAGLLDTGYISLDCDTGVLASPATRGMLTSTAKRGQVKTDCYKVDRKTYPHIAI